MAAKTLFAVGGADTGDRLGTVEVFGMLSSDRGENAGATALDSAEVGSVGYMAAVPESRTLYVASTRDAEARITEFHWSTEGQLDLIGIERIPEAAAHLCVSSDRRYLLTAHYGHGSIAVFRILEDGLVKTDEFCFEGSGPHPRQAASHPHQVKVVGTSYVVPDLGTDLVHAFDLSDDGKLEHRRQWRMPAGSGPRHAVAADGTLYVSCELSGEVRWVSLEDGAPFDGVIRSSNSTSAEIMPSAIEIRGEKLFVANRGPGTIMCARLARGDLLESDEFASGGTWPRDFEVIGSDLVIADLRSERVRVVQASAPHAVLADLAVLGPTCVVALQDD